MIWYKETIEKLYEILDTSEDGLSNAEANQRLRQYGPNLLVVKTTSVWTTILEPFKSIFVVILLIAALVSVLSHSPIDAAIIMIIIFINAFIFYGQKYTTNKVLRSLKKKSIQKVSVLRDGVQISILSPNLVPGDIIVLSEGERVPVDARIVHVDNLEVDESSLTGESNSVHKYASTLSSNKQIFEQDNMLFSGTYVTTGVATALVVETGIRTEYGKIVELTSEDESTSPVQAKIDNLVRLLIKVIAAIAVFVLVLSLIRGIPTSEALRFALSLAVSAVPEGLPVALTVIIVLGMRRMARRNALVRTFKAIEDIGLVTTIVTDKTGTLTKNHLTVADSWSYGKEDVGRIASYTIDPDDKPKDSIDIVIHEHASKYKRRKIDVIYPFDIDVRMSGAYIEEDKAIYIKGSPEHVLAQSISTKKEHYAIESAMHSFTSKGYRVIAIGRYKVVGKSPLNLMKIKNKKIEFIGFLALADEIRVEAAQSIKLAQDANITVRMITGDHYETAYNVGKQLGIASHINQVIQGADLPKDDELLAKAIEGKTIFARFLPTDKFRILKALKKTEVTAMTGDGVNDAPALANANVGIAMGSGSDIAKDSGGIILLDDNFSTIIKAIAEGRRIFSNIRKMLFYLLSTTIGEIVTMIGALLIGLPLPVTAIQILWINLVTDTVMVLPLGIEPEERRLMKRPPRGLSEPLLDRILKMRIVLVAITIAVGVLGTILILDGQGYSQEYIQTVAFLALITAQWANAFNAKSEYTSLFSKSSRLNRGLIFGLAVGALLQSLVMFGPLGSIFNIQKVGLVHLILPSVLMVISILLVVEAHKLFIRIRYKT